MSNWRVKLSLFLNYFVFAILLNSVGIVILQVINNYGVAEKDAAILEACKDISIAVFSFAIASFLPRLGYRKAMLTGLFIVIIACLTMTQVSGFTMTKILFICVGVSFALIKVSVYSTVGLITNNPDEHASFMSMLEGVFQTGVLAGYWIFSYFILSKTLSWSHTYWVLAVMSACAFILLYLTKIDESSLVIRSSNVMSDFVDMLKLVRFPLVMVFILCVFLYVFTEQGIQSWLPTFNNKILQLPEAISVQITSILAGGIALGRIFAGFLMKKVKWIFVLVFCLISAMTLVLLVLPLSKNIAPGAVTNWSSVPIAAFIFPLIGFFLAPIYPTICSIVLSKMPKSNQSSMTGLIVIFSALGGTIGSRITGELFSRMNGITAFYFSLVPMLLLLIGIFYYKKLQDIFNFEDLTTQSKEGESVA
jgi:fucose permease